MKDYIEMALLANTINKTPRDVVLRLFTEGNGREMSRCGFLYGNYRGEEVYHFPEPEPFSFVPPLGTLDENHLLYRLSICRDVGFKETAKYFIECLKKTSPESGFAKEWHDNIIEIEDVLLNTPPMADTFSSEHDLDTFISLLPEDSPSPKGCVTRVWYIDIQKSKVPEMVEKDVRYLWWEYELGNDHYVYHATLDEELYDSYPYLYFWLVYCGVLLNAMAVVHWWW